MSLESILDAVGRAFPDHSPTTIFLGLHFTIGTMHHTLHVLAQLRHLPNCPDEPLESERVTKRLVAYTASGIRAQHQPK